MKENFLTFWDQVSRSFGPSWIKTKNIVSKMFLLQHLFLWSPHAKSTKKYWFLLDVDTHFSPKTTRFNFQVRVSDNILLPKWIYLKNYQSLVLTARKH